LIDQSKWANFEFVRRAENGALHSAVRTYQSALNNYLVLKDPSGVYSIEAKVTVNAINTNNLFAGARIGGFFFSDAAGTYYAQIQIEQDTLGGLTANYLAQRCTAGGVQCTSFNDRQTGLIGPVNIGESHTLGIVYDGSIHFTFNFDSNPVGTITTNPVLPLGSPSVQWMGIGTRVWGMSNPGVSGYVDANFENVSINGNHTAISDSNGMIDRNTWSDNTLEFVREQITHGVYGLAVRSPGSFMNSYMDLVGGGTFNELQADLTVEQLMHSPNTSPTATPQMEDTLTPCSIMSMSMVPFTITLTPPLV